MNQCEVFITFSNFYNQQLIQYFALSHYHCMAMGIVIIIISSSSHRKQSNTIHKIFTWKPKSWGENHGRLFNNSCPKITGCKEQLSYYIDFNFSASTERRLRPPVLQAATWRKLPLPSFSASTGRRLRPPFLAPSCHPDKKNIAEPVDLSNTKPCTLYWYHLHSDHCQIFSVVNTVTSFFLLMSSRSC